MLASLPLGDTAQSLLLTLLLFVFFTAYGLLLLGSRPGRDDSSLLIRWTAWLLAGAISYAGIGTLLALLGLYRPWLLIALLLLSGLGAAWFRRRSRAARAERSPEPEGFAPSSGIQLAIAATLAVFALLLAPSSECLLVGGDPAVYAVAGIKLAQTGTLYHQPAWAPELGYAGIRQLFHQSGTLQMTRHWMPFYQATAFNPTVEIGFLPLTKVWIALGALLAGPAQASAVSGFATLVGLLALCVLIGRRGRWGFGYLSMVILGLLLPQIWFGRQATSEIYAQMMLLGALCLLALARNAHEHASWLRLFAGLAIALLPLTRFEGLPLSLALLVILWLANRTMGANEGPSARWYAFTAGGSLLSALLAAIAALHYVTTSLALLLTPPRARWLTLLLLAGLLVAVLLWRNRLPLAKRCARWLQPRTLQRALLLGWVAWLLLAAYQYLTHGVTASLAGWLSLYLTLPGLVLSLAGALLLARTALDERAPERWTLGALGLVFLIIFSLNHYVTPVHPWAVRRLLPVVWPALAVAAATLIERPRQLLRASGRRALVIGGLAIQIVATGALLLALLTLVAPILSHKECDGFWQQLRTATDDLPAGAVVLLDSSPASQGLSQPLELLLGHPSFAVPSTVGDDVGPQLDALVAQARDAGREVYLLTTGGQLDWYPADALLEHQGLRSLRVPALRQSADGPPGFDARSELIIPLDVYRLAELDAQAGATSLTITAGPGSAPYLREGFYDIEGNAEVGYIRWTDGDARLILPKQLLPDGPCRLRLIVASGHPEGPVPLRVSLQEASLDAVELPAGFAPQTLEWMLAEPPSSSAPGIEVRLRCDSWTPGNGDERQLGLMFHQLTIEPITPEP